MAPACAPAPGGGTGGVPAVEYQAVAPKEFLAWLIRELSRLQPKIPEGYWCNLSQDTQDKRRALLVGDPATVWEGLQAPEEAWPSGTHRAWWALEGPTRVDCALFTDDTVIFVEGKRTEMGPSEAIIWYPTRNQVLRNLECARTEARLHGLKHYFVILAVEEAGPSADDATAYVGGPRALDRIDRYRGCGRQLSGGFGSGVLKSRFRGQHCDADSRD